MKHSFHRYYYNFSLQKNIKKCAFNFVLRISLGVVNRGVFPCNSYWKYEMISLKMHTRNRDMRESSDMACHVTTAAVGKVIIMIIINTVIITPVTGAASCSQCGMAPPILPAIAGGLCHVIGESHFLLRLRPAIFTWNCSCRGRRPWLAFVGVAVVLAVPEVEVLQERDEHEAPAQGDVHYKP